MEFLVATAIGLVGLFLTWLALKEQRKSMSREIELKLWDESDLCLQGRVELHNGSRERAIIDLIRVVDPERSKIAWHPRKSDAPLPSIETLDDADVTDEHKVRLEVPPGGSAGVSFVIGLPYSVTTLDRITVECRIFPKDRLFGLIPNEWRKVSLPTRLIQKRYARPPEGAAKKATPQWLSGVPKDWLG